MGKKLLLSLCTFVLMFFLVEGVLSWFWHRSWRGIQSGEPALTALRAQQDEERFAAAATNPGPYRIHPDPLVRYVLKGNHEQEIKGALVRSDALGLRRRVGPEFENPFRIAILGDSVAFGWGLPDQQTLAAQLEQLLNEVRPQGAQPIECRTVAIPGWNTRNAVHFLLDHLDELQPDVTIFLPVENDLEDSDTAYDTGHRRNDFNLQTRDPLVIVKEPYRFWFAVLTRAQAAGKTLDPEAAGARALISGLSAESQWRIQDSATALLELQQRLQEQGRKFAVATYQQHDVHHLTQTAIRQRDGFIPEIALLQETVPDDTLGNGDSHPHQGTVAVYAHWIAEWLLEQQWLPQSKNTELPRNESMAERRAEPLSADELQIWQTQYAAAMRTLLTAQIEEASGVGVSQIYGGINVDGSLGPRFLAMLAHVGPQLEVRCSGLVERPDLYPMQVRCEVNGQFAGDWTIARANDKVVQQLQVPATIQADVLEIKLIASHWGVSPIFGSSQLVSFQFESIRCFEP